MRSLRAHALKVVTLTPAQREAIMSACELLPPPQRYSFVVRVDQKLSLRCSGSVGDALITDVVNTVFNQMQMRETA